MRWLLFLILMLVSPFTAEALVHYTRFPVINMQEEPDPLAPVVSQARYGVELSLIASERDWVKIATPDGYEGWIPEAALLSRWTPYSASSNIGRVQTLCAHIYRQPDITSSPPIISLPFATPIEFLSPPSEERWHAITLVDGSEGWIQKGDFTTRLDPLSIEEMAALSQQFIGLPYTWGGTSSFGFDCSGFVQMLYRLVGIDLPRDSSQQAVIEEGVRIPRDELEVGDLLVFGTNPPKVNHVGIYLGDGKYIHAAALIKSGSPTVRIDEIDEKNPLKQFMTGIRLYMPKQLEKSAFAKEAP